MRRNELNIDVRRDDIDAGVRGHCCDCPIALATRRRLKGAFVSASYEGISVGVPKAADRIFDISRDVERFMSDFDAGRLVKPSRFTLVRRSSRPRP